MHSIKDLQCLPLLVRLVLLGRGAGAQAGWLVQPAVPGPPSAAPQVDHLHSLLELLVRKEPQLLPDFLPEVLELQVG